MFVRFFGVGTSNPKGDRTQWGGFAEAIAISFYWKVRIVFGHDHDAESVFLLTEPAGPPEPAGPLDAVPAILVLWTGGHYELLVMTSETSDEAKKPAT